MANIVDVTLRLVDKFSSNWTAITKACSSGGEKIEKVGKSIMKAGDNIASVGKGLTNTFSKPILDVAKDSFNMAADFEKDMAKVKSICGATGGDFDKLKNKAKDLMNNSVHSASEVADAYVYMGMAGWDAKDMVSEVGHVLDLSSASGENLGRVSDIVTDGLTAFGLKASDTGRFVDTLAKVSTITNTNVKLLGESFSVCAPVAGTLGYSVEDVSKALGIMASSGVKGSKAGTALRNVMKNLTGDNKNVKKVMNDLGVSITDSSGKMKPLSSVLDEIRNKSSKLSEKQKVNVATTLAGAHGMAGFSSIMKASKKDYDDVSKKMESVNGACKDMADTAQNNTKDKIEKLRNSIDLLKIKLGESFLPIAEKVISKIKDWANAFSKLSPKTQATIVKIAGIVAVVGPVVLVIGKIVKSVGAVILVIGKVIKIIGIIAGAISGTALIIAGVVAVVVAIAVVVVKNWDAIKAKTVEVFSAIGSFFSNIWSSICNGVRSFVNSVGNILSGIKDWFMGIIDWIGSTFSGLWSNAWNGIKSIFGSIFNSLGDLIKKPINAVVGAINGVISAINNVGFTIPDWVPKLGGKKFSIDIPSLPTLASGTDFWGGGIVQISERGGEIVDLPRGSRVYPHDKSVNKAFNDGVRSGSITVNIPKLADNLSVRSDNDIYAIAQAIADKLESVSNNLGGGSLGYNY